MLLQHHPPAQPRHLHRQPSALRLLERHCTMPGSTRSV
jgi:hypothetical protein